MHLIYSITEKQYSPPDTCMYQSCLGMFHIKAGRGGGGEAVQGIAPFLALVLVTVGNAPVKMVLKVATSAV